MEVGTDRKRPGSAATEPPNSSSAPFPALLLIATTAVTDKVHERLAEAGFPGFKASYGYAFQLLASTGGATGVDLARHLGVTKQSAGELLSRLSQAGYVTTSSHPSDSRANISALSSRGWDCIDTAERIWRELEAEFIDSYGAQDFAIARGLLEQVVARLTSGESLRLKPPR